MVIVATAPEPVSDNAGVPPPAEGVRKTFPSRPSRARVPAATARAVSRWRPSDGHASEGSLRPRNGFPWPRLLLRRTSSRLALFHVEREQHSPRPANGQKRGRLVGIPGRRGRSSGTGPTRRRRWTRTSSVEGDASGARDMAASESAGHRSAPGSGGSVTTRRAPSARNPAPHSAVTAGGPNKRAVTRSATPRSAGSWARSSARPWMAVTRPPHPRRSIVAVSRRTRR